MRPETTLCNCMTSESATHCPTGHAYINNIEFRFFSDFLVLSPPLEQGVYSTGLGGDRIDFRERTKFGTMLKQSKIADHDRNPKKLDGLMAQIIDQAK